MLENQSSFSHLDEAGNPSMVDVGKKAVTRRIAHARSSMYVGEEILEHLENGEIQSPKGPVFHTAIIAGTMAVKKTSDLIPLCHPLPIEKIKIEIAVNENREIVIDCTVGLSGKTGVEMEALTGATVAALTIYDMCKAFSHNMRIIDTRLMEKTGGKRDFKRE